MSVRWSVEIEAHEVTAEKRYEDAACEMKVFMNKQQALVVRRAILEALSDEALANIERMGE